MILAVVGPTAVGKTDAVVELARRIPSEVVVVDSMQVYRGMDIGTGKPSPVIREELVHHGLDLVEPEEEFDVARYARLMRPALDAIRARGRLSVLVGGSGLYYRALIDGLCRAPGCDLLLRQGLIEEERTEGDGILYDRLQRVDPEAARRVHPRDLRRTVRALEVYGMTGMPLSVWQKETTEAYPRREEVRWIGLTCDRDRLYRQIDERVDGWLASGWLEEARALSKRSLGRTAREALGYRELFAHLRGELEWAQTRRLIHRNTRRYAKRQWAWFRQDQRVQWIEVQGKLPAQIAEEILRRTA